MKQAYLFRGIFCIGSIAALIPEGLTAADAPPRVLTRLIFQDDDAKTLKWADLLAGDPPQLGPITLVSGFPELDKEHQSLVQMEAASSLVLVGVRDDDDGQFQSGWILVDTGIDADEHGDHVHWSYPRTPLVRAQVLDKQQGNPAHLYVYDGLFYLANDQKNGFIRVPRCSPEMCSFCRSRVLSSGPRQSDRAKPLEGRPSVANRLEYARSVSR